MNQTYVVDSRLRAAGLSITVQHLSRFSFPFANCRRQSPRVGSRLGGSDALYESPRTDTEPVHTSHKVHCGSDSIAYSQCLVS